MDYAQAFHYLQIKARQQANFRIANRTEYDLHIRYSVHLHGTHQWVTKKDWRALWDPKAKTENDPRLNLANYTRTQAKADEEFRYAVPVPGKPIYLKVYRTDVAKFNADGTTVFSSGGWHGFFTGRWLNMCKHMRVISERVDRHTPTIWTVTDAWGVRSKFYDGLILDKDGRIISDVDPVAKHVIDRSKSKLWHGAVKRFCEQALPFVAMLDGVSPPAPVLKAMRESKVTHFDDKMIADHILSGQEYDPVLTTMLCMQRWYGYNPTAWASNDSDHVVHNARLNFEARLRTVYRAWVRANALKEV